MSKFKFADELSEYVSKTLGNQYTVMVRYCGEDKEAEMLIRNKKMSTAFGYGLEILYETYVGGIRIEAIGNDLMMQHIENELRDTPYCETEYWESVKQNICLCLVSTENSEKLLETVPHRNFLDLSIIYYVPVNIPNITKGHFTITYEVMEHLGMTEKTLYEFAYSNTQKVRPSKIMSMEEYLNSQLTGCRKEDELKTDDFLYILTNSVHDNGAAIILYKSIVKEFAQKLKAEKLFLMPSSVHEWVVTPFNNLVDIDYFNELVKEQNAEGYISDWEVLSSNCYIFDTKTDTITVA